MTKDRPIRFGILGAAKIAPNALTMPAKQVPKVEVTAIAARDPARAREFGKANGIPRVLAQVRKRTYQRYAWPAFLARAFERNGLAVALVTVASLVLFFIAMALADDPARLFQAHSDADGSFYAVLPHGAMAGAFGR